MLSSLPNARLSHRSRALFYRIYHSLIFGRQTLQKGGLQRLGRLNPTFSQLTAKVGIGSQKGREIRCSVCVSRNDFLVKRRYRLALDLGEPLEIASLESLLCRVRYPANVRMAHCWRFNASSTSCAEIPRISFIDSGVGSRPFSRFIFLLKSSSRPRIAK